MKTTLLTFGLALAITACGSSKTEEKTENREVAVTKNQNQSQGISDYMSLKDALVQTDAKAAKDAASKLVESAANENWNADIVNAIRAIATSDDVEAQRVAFKTVTDGLIEILKTNTTNDGVYVQYCPMALDNTGASWLSTSDQIRNPYFGDKMLKCGKVTEEL